MRSIRDYWYEVYQHGYHIRQYQPERGLEGWQTYKNTYGSNPMKFTLSDSYKKLFESVNYVSNGSEDADATITVVGQTYSNTIEKYHFLVQLFRIPKLAGFTLPLVKVLQIAYNAGQLQAMIDNNAYTSELIQFINTNKLTSIESYLDDSGKSIDVKTGSCEYQSNIVLVAVLAILCLIVVFWYLARCLGESLVGNRSFSSTF